MAYKRKKDRIFMGKDGRWRERKHNATYIYWTGQMISDLKRFYPTTLNDELSEILQVSIRTMQRKAQELGLIKDDGWILKKWEENRLLACVRSKQLGYPGVFEMNKKRRKRNDVTITLPTSKE